MIWALLEITLPLCLTFLGGLIAGWMFWRWRRTQITSTDWEAHTQSNDQEEILALRGEHNKALTVNEQMQTKISSLEETVEKQINELVITNKNSKRLSDELAAAKLKLEAQPESLEDQSSVVSDLHNKLAQANIASTGLSAKFNQASGRTEELTKANNELQQKLKQSETIANERDAAIAKLEILEERLSQSNLASTELAQAKSQLATLDEKFKNFQASVVANRRVTDEEKSKLRATADQLRSELNADKQKSGPNNATVELNQAKANIANLNSQLNEAKLKLAQNSANDSVQTPADATDKIAELNEKNSELRKALERLRNNNASNANAPATANSPENNQDIQRIRRALAETRAQLNHEKTRSANLESKLTEQKESTASPVTPISVGQIKKLKSELAAKEVRIAALEKKLKNKPAKQNRTDKQNKAAKQKPSADWQKGQTKLGTPGSNHKDDLTAINGIGPKIEKVLNRLGIKSWEQLAALKAADIKTVDDALKDFSGRIKRDEWVPQAKAIMRNGHQPINSKAALTTKPKKTKKPKKNAWQNGTTKFGTPGSSHRDDLKVINGIGPVIEKSLNRFGVKSWEQLATLSAKDVKTIDAALAFPGRIDREQWVKQAKDLVKLYPIQNERPTRRTFLNQAAS